MRISMQEQTEILKDNEKILKLLGVLIILIIAVVFLVIVGEKKNKDSDIVSELYFENISERKELGRLHIIEEKKDNIYFKVEYPEIGNNKIDKLIEGIIDTKINEVKNKYNDNMYYYFIQYEVYLGNGNIVSLVIRESLDSKDLDNVISAQEVYYFSLSKGVKLDVKDIFDDNYEEVLEKLIGYKDDINFVIKNDKIVFIDLNEEIELTEFSDVLKINIDDSMCYSNTIKDKSSVVINKKQKVNQDVVMYDRDSIASNIIYTIKKDMTLNVYSNLSNGFSVIFYNDGLGYIETKYLVDESDVQDIKEVFSVISTIRKTMYVIDTVNIRSGPSTSYGKVGQLHYGDKVIETGYIDDWVRIEFSGKEAFIKKDFISTEEVVRHTVYVDVPANREIDSSKPMVALTFDDGPNDTSTVKILDILEQYNVRATFFDLGRLVLNYPEVVKREATLGEVATHTYSHKDLNTLTPEEIEEELRLARDAQKQVLGEYPKLIRPPYGNVNVDVKNLITDMAIVNWNVDSLDWKYRNKDLTLNEIYKYGDLNGKIILLHSIHASTAEVVEVLVPKLIEDGYQIVTVSELAKYKGYTLETGIVYSGFK